MQKQLQAGDVVQLKSGGPNLTVNSASNTEAVVVWMDQSAVHAATILVACLNYVSGASDDQPPHPK
jgi:uncharacterized protein YodC (DUF2158 family)